MIKKPRKKKKIKFIRNKKMNEMIVKRERIMNAQAESNYGLNPLGYRKYGK